MKTDGEKRMLDTAVQKAIQEALERGNSVEVKRNKEGIVVYEVQKKIRYKVPAASGRQDEPKGASQNW